MDILPKQVVMGGVIAIATILTSFLLTQTKITTDLFLTLNPLPLANVLLSTQFILFLLSSSLTIALIMLCEKEIPTPFNSIIPIIGVILGGVIGFILFHLVEIIIITIISVIAVPFTANFLVKRESEVKYLKKFRGASAAAGRFVTILTFGIALYLLLIGFVSQTRLSEDVVDDILATTIGNEVTFQDTIQSPLILGMIESQKLTLSMIEKLPAFTPLLSKTDPETIAFISSLQTLETRFNDPEYKATLKQQALQNPQLNLGKSTLSKLPFIETIAKNAWIVYPISALLLLLFINSLFTKNLAAGMYWIISTLLDRVVAKPKAEENK